MLLCTGIPPASIQQGKTPKTAARRRALGDITNATPARGVVAGSKASAAKSAAHFAAADPTPTAKHHSIAQAQIEAWAEEGVESRAGKSWAVLEAERRRRDDADIDACVEATLSSLAPRRPAFGLVSAVPIPCQPSSPIDSQAVPFGFYGYQQGLNSWRRMTP